MRNPYSYLVWTYDVKKLDKASMIEVLTKNFGFETTDDDDYGLAVKMSARDAFRYSLNN